jgi:DNA gyrase subunit A
MGRTAAGVWGIRMKKGDELVGMDVVGKGQKGLDLLVLSQNGYGKRSAFKFYKSQNRGGSGIKTAKITTKTGGLVWAKVVSTDETQQEDMIVISEKGQVIRIPLKSVSSLGRATQGVRIMKPKAGDRLSAATIL